jgi:uncharacterized membrane protein
VQGLLKSERRSLAVASPVHWTEVIETGPESAARVVFLDQTELSTGPNSQVTLDQFVYSADPGSQKMAIGLGKGVMRFVTGTMDSRAYELKAQGAIIGFRGTAVVALGEGGAQQLKLVDDFKTLPEILEALKDFENVTAEFYCSAGIIEAVVPGTTTPLSCPQGKSVRIEKKEGQPVKVTCVEPSDAAQLWAHHFFTQEAVTNGAETVNGLDSVLLVWKDPGQTQTKQDAVNLLRTIVDSGLGTGSCSAEC